MFRAVLGHHSTEKIVLAPCQAWHSYEVSRIVPGAAACVHMVSLGVKIIVLAGTVRSSERRGKKSAMAVWWDKETQVFAKIASKLGEVGGL